MCLAGVGTINLNSQRPWNGGVGVYNIRSSSLSGRPESVQPEVRVSTRSQSTHNADSARRNGLVSSGGILFWLDYIKDRSDIAIVPFNPNIQGTYSHNYAFTSPGPSRLEFEKVGGAVPQAYAGFSSQVFVLIHDPGENGAKILCYNLSPYISNQNVNGLRTQPRVTMDIRGLGPNTATTLGGRDGQNVYLQYGLAVSTNEIYVSRGTYLKVYDREGNDLEQDEDMSAFGVTDVTGMETVNGVLYFSSRDHLYRRVPVSGHLGSWSVQRSTDGGTSWQNWDDTNGTFTSLPLSDDSRRSRVFSPRGGEVYRVDLGDWYGGSQVEHLFRAQTRTTDGLESTWSTPKTIIPAESMGLALVSPASGDIPAEYQPRWEVANQTNYRIISKDDVGIVLQDSGIVTDVGNARTHSWSGSGDDRTLAEVIPVLLDGEAVSIEVHSADASKFYGETVTHDGFVRYLAPHQPTVHLVDFDNTHGTVIAVARVNHVDDSRPMPDRVWITRFQPTPPCLLYTSDAADE